MADYGFLREAGPTVGDLLAGRDPALPPLVHIHPHETVRQAIAVLREFGVSQVPVIKHEPPIVVAEVTGSVTERGLMDRVLADASMLTRSVSDVTEPPLPTIGSGEQLQVAVARLESAPALLVLDRGHPIGVVTRSDVLSSLATEGR
jgi:cystathionine beta-synthase